MARPDTCSGNDLRPRRDRWTGRLLNFCILAVAATTTGVAADTSDTLAVPALQLEERAEATNSAVAGADSPSISPRTAMLRSAVLPGWGQLSNDRPLKGLLFGAAAAVSLGNAIAEARALAAAVTPAQHQDRAARRNTRFLFLAVTATLAAVDAFVDAHLADFPAAAAAPAALQLRPGTGATTIAVSYPLP